MRQNKIQIDIILNNEIFFFNFRLSATAGYCLIETLPTGLR